MPVEIWLPESARPAPKVVLRCKVPGCDKRFPPTQRGQFERHVSACAKKNMDAIQQEAADRESDRFTSVGDKEQHRWVRRLASEIGPDEANKRLRHGSRRKRKETA